VTAILAAPDFENSDYLIFATAAGEVKKSPLKDFSQVRRNGLRAMNLEEGDFLLDVKHCRAADEIILVTERGQSARFNVDVLRTASRISGGVRGIRLLNGDRLASMDVVRPDAQLLVVTHNGYGKRTPLSAYPTKGRGIGGVRAIRTTDKTGTVSAARVVDGYEELMMISSGGIIVRIAIDSITEYSGRMTSGVKVMNVREGDTVAAIALLDPEPNGNGDEPEAAADGETEVDDGGDGGDDGESDAETDPSLAEALPGAEADEADEADEDDIDDELDDVQDEELVADTDEDSIAETDDRG
jgi:DNA gyrase subunit A